MIKQFYAAITLAAMSLTATAQGSMVFDFMVQSNFSKCTQSCYEYDHDGYTAWQFSAYNSTVVMNNYSINEPYYADYLTSPELDLEAGNLYVITTAPASYSYNAVTNYSVLLGQGDDERQYTVLREFKDIPYKSSSYDFTSYEIPFFVETSGKYHISLLGGPRKLCLKNTNVKNLGVVLTPVAPDDFLIQPDPDGKLEVTVSFTMPVKTMSGTAITDPMSYSIFRGQQAVKTGNAAAGEKVTYRETLGEEGTVFYGVQVTYGSDSSEKISAESYVGPETPEAPADANATLADNGFKVTWTAPTKGLHGAALAADKLTYKVTRYLDGEATELASGLAATEYTDSFTYDGLHVLRYEVIANYGAKSSAATGTPSLKIGTANLPFADSFSGGTLSELWDNEIISGDKLWEVVSVDPNNGNLPDELRKPVDDDGGMALFKTYSYSKTNQTRLVTPSFNYTAGDKIVASFFVRHLNKGNNKEAVILEVSSDYGEWKPVETIVIKAADNEWKQYNLTLNDFITAGCKTFRVGFETVNDYQNNILIDAVKIFKQYGKDLSAAISAVTPEVKAGNDMSLVVEVSNNGSQTVDNYSVSIDGNYSGDIEMPEIVAIEPLSSVKYTVSLPLNSAMMAESATYSFTATVTTEGDEDSANNTSAPCSVTGSYSPGTPASELTGFKNVFGDVYMSWKPAVDLDYQPVALMESFEDCEEGAIGPFNGWVSVDIDGKEGDTWYGASGSLFKVVNNSNNPRGKDGNNVIGVTINGGVEQDDWLISPAVSCKAGSSMNLSFLLGFRYASTAYNMGYQVSVHYATEDYDALNPAAAFTHQVGDTRKYNSEYGEVKLDDKLYPVTFTGIPAEAKYVAIHFSGKSAAYYNKGVVWVDSLALTEDNQYPLLGYRIYSTATGLATDELLDITATGHIITAENSPLATYSLGNMMFVTAVYPDGEAEPSNMLDVDKIPTGVEDITVDHGDAVYYDLQGRRLDKTPSAPGVYIRRQGGKAVKVRL